MASDFTSGASSDIQHATKLAKAMVYDWGMSKKIGFLALGASSQVFIGRDYQTKNDFSEKLAGLADDEIMDILNKNYKRAKDLLVEKIDILHEMAKLLLARETIYKDEVDMVMQGKKTEEIVAEMEAKEKEQKEKEAKIREENIKLQKLENFRKKLAEGENLVKMGVISQMELDNLNKDYIEFKKSLENPQPQPTEEVAKETEVENKPVAENAKETVEEEKVEEAGDKEEKVEEKKPSTRKQSKPAQNDDEKKDGEEN